MTDPEGIYNWRRLDDRITTSGQPTEEQLADIQALGVQHVVNLALHTHEKALPDEAASVRALAGRFPEPDPGGLRAVLRLYGAVQGCSDARALHRELPGLGVLLSVPAGCIGLGRCDGARPDGRDLEAGRCVGGLYSALTIIAIDYLDFDDMEDN